MDNQKCVNTIDFEQQQQSEYYTVLDLKSIDIHVHIVS